MSMLDRYKKPGGFVQLLALIETCNQAKQEKLLEIISMEDLFWAETVRAKMLSIDRIYSWNDQALAEIFGILQDLTVAVALHSAPDELKKRITGFFAHGRIRKIDELLGSNGPSSAEIASTHMKIIESVRKMGTNGFLRFDSIDPLLVIDDTIDDQLARAAIPGQRVSLKAVSSPANAPSDAESAFTAPALNPRTLHSYSTLSDHVAARAVVPGDVTMVAAAPGSPASATPGSSQSSESKLMEIQTLKKRVAELSKENAVLRHELSIVRSKLDQIKKIA